MSVWKLIKLKFGRSVAHFGELGIGIEETSERVQSDTLFSAWMSAYARLFGKQAATDFLEEFNTEPKFHLSSTFIYRLIEGKLVYYLPRPLKFPPGYPIGNDLNFTKTCKKLKYLPLEVWQRWYQGSGFTDSDRQELVDWTTKTKGQDHALEQAGTFDYSKAFEFSKVPKIAVDRTTRATNLYHTGFVQYQWQPNYCEPNGIESLSGLYFLVHFSDAKEADTFFAVLDFLGGEGIGGERSSGAGQFKVDHSSYELTPLWQQVFEAPKTNHHSLVSLFWTNNSVHLQELLAETATSTASYELQERGGWIASPCSDGRQLRRQTVQMFTEGSVFPIAPQGKLADVTPPGFEQQGNGHKVYRSGISLSLPIKVSTAS